MPYGIPYLIDPLDSAIRGFKKPHEVWVLISDNRVVYFGYLDKVEKEVKNYTESNIMPALSPMGYLNWKINIR